MQGQFIYITFAFKKLAEKLSTHKMWTLQELAAHLPTGLSSMFHSVLDDLFKALTKDKRRDLMILISTGVLPVLVVSRQPLTLAELAWATGGTDEQVRVHKTKPMAYAAVMTSRLVSHTGISMVHVLIAWSSSHTGL